MNELVGQQIDRYRIEALLGEGGMAAVYRAFDLNLKRPVALKIVHPHLARQPQFQQRFMREARTAAQLSHPAIITIHHVGSEHSFLYMAMDLVPEGALGDYIARRQANRSSRPRQALLIVAQVADALAYAHEQGVVHGDIKPGNILLKLLNRPKRAGDLPLQAVVTDFGLATLLQEQAEDTAPDLFMGSLPYMSPEQCMSKKLDGRSDLYSLGIVLFQLITGQLPFDIKLPTDAVMKHVNEPPPRPSLIRAYLSAEIEALMLKALAKKPDDRFQTGDEMAQALRQATVIAEASSSIFPPQNGSDGSLTQLSEREWSGVPVQIAAAQIEIGDQDLIIMAREGETATTHALDKNIISLGRNRKNDIILNANNISRHHARLEKGPAGWQIVDLDSANGAFLDGSRLLPDVLETWSQEQTLRIGDFFLQWRKGKRRASEEALGESHPVLTAEPDGAAAAADIHRTDQLSAKVDPSEASVTPGSPAEITVALLNQGETVGHFQVRVDGLPNAWVALPEEGLQLLPGERGTATVLIQPPQDSSATAGHHPYQIILTDSARNEMELMRLPCGLHVAPFESFTADMQPKILRNEGTCRVLISNSGNFAATYSVIGRDDGAAIHFLDPRQERTRATKVRQQVAVPTGVKKLARLPIIKRLPLVRRLSSAERSVARWGKLAQPGKRATGKPPPAVRLGAFHTRVKIAAGKQESVDLVVKPKERPLLARSQKTHAFQVQVSTATADQPHILPGQLEVTPIIPPWLPPLLLFLLLAGAVLFALFTDSDADGVANGAEIAMGTNPQDSDTDKDGATDGQEVAAKTDPTDPESVAEPSAITTPELPPTPITTPMFITTPTITVTLAPGTVDSLLGTADSFATIEDTPLNSAPLSVLDNDAGAEGVSLIAILDTEPANGNLALNANGAFLYTPDENFNGIDSFAYHASDGFNNSDVVTAVITVAAANDSPEAAADRYSMAENTTLNIFPRSVLDNDTEVDGDPFTAVLDNGPENGSVQLNGDGAFSYTPNPNFFGSDTFTYHANDGSQNSNTATVIISVGEENDAPAAVNDEFSTNEDIPLNNTTLNVLGNDSDPENDGLTAVLISGPTNGAITLRPDGAFVYTPHDEFSGADNFTYAAYDGRQNSNIATVIITVSPVDDPPEAMVDRYNTSENSTLDIVNDRQQPSVLANDMDVDSALLTAVLERGPENGVLPTFGEDGRFIYVPDRGFFGTDTFTYHANDGASNSNTMTVIITVGSSNNPPTGITLDQNALFENQPANAIIGLFTTIDPDDNFHTYSLTQNTDSAFTIKDNALKAVTSFDFEEKNSYDIVVQTNDGQNTFSQPFTINILDQNEPPMFTSTPITTAAPSITYTYTITATDVDAGDILTITAQSTLPSWLTLSDTSNNNGIGTAILRGIPFDCYDYGTYHIELQVTDKFQHIATQAFDIIVPNNCSTLVYDD